VGQERLSSWIEAAARAYPGDAFDMIHVFRTATLPFAERYLNREGGREVEWHLDLDDVESRVQERLARLYERHGRAAEQFAAERQAEQATRQEGEILRAWDRVYVCSEQDRDELQRRAGWRSAGIVVLPNVVRLPADPPPAPRSGCPTILYLGTFGYFPNADAAVWLCREILPVIREQSPGPVRLVLVGSGTPAEVRALRHIPEVEFVGEVPDIAPWYARADLVVVPLRVGGGARIKLLEALAYPRPAVSTSIGAEGLDLVDDEHLLIADRGRHFGQQCLRLLGDAGLAARLAEAGRRRVEQRYSLQALEPFIAPR
jgi:glycosyltransferase involved in cell wall biosynthesis